ncbi:hypothetical protein AB0L40_22440 [Patulibacter sp. NPDC049589]|uniref:hypothetical protein n=1 Tax=Patulibacter sp. NPDC049589 TaxID=3154731 RepID=UPI00344587A1
MSTSNFTAARRLRTTPAPPAIQLLHVARAPAVVPTPARPPRPSAYLAPPFPFSGPVVGASHVSPELVS